LFFNHCNWVNIFMHLFNPMQNWITLFPLFLSEHDWITYWWLGWFGNVSMLCLLYVISPLIKFVLGFCIYALHIFYGNWNSVSCKVFFSWLIARVLQFDTEVCKSPRTLERTEGLLDEEVTLMRVEWRKTPRWFKSRRNLAIHVSLYLYIFPNFIGVLMLSLVKLCSFVRV